MINAAFIDTSAFLALYDARDKYHIRAKIALKRIKKQKIKLFTTDYVFDETLTSVLYAFGYRTAVTASEALLSSNVVEIVYIDRELKEEAWKFFKQYGAMKLSFTDCTSFAFMKQKLLTHAFTFDEDFKKTGFKLWE